VRYATLGKSGIEVSRICLGSATFGAGPLGDDIPALIGRARDLGINFFDTANSYGNQARFDRPSAPPADKRLSAEELIGKALAGSREQVVIASKVREPVEPFGVNDSGLSRVHIMKQVEQSLRRLRTDYIDIYYAHHPDPQTPIETTVRVFDELIKQGKIRYWALSTFSGAETIEALWAADRAGLNGPVCHQARYNLADREVEADVLPASLRHGLSLTVFSPLGNGVLAGPEATARAHNRRARTDEELALSRNLDELAVGWGVPSAHLALCWLLDRPGVACAIVGAETPAEIEANAAAADIDLDADQLALIDALSARTPR
jgi:aryl-alcohol dehydrogenase-like predicted oxidoreductase